MWLISAKMQGIKAGSNIFKGENEGKAKCSSLISESFIYKCSFKRLISSYSWTVNPCGCAHIISPSFTAMKRKLGLYLWMRDFSFHTATELSLKANQWLKGKALLSSPVERGHPQQPGVTCKFHLQKHQRRPLAPWKIKIPTCLWTILEYSETPSVSCP